MRQILFVLSFLALAANVQAQEKNIWRTLSLIKFEKQFSENDGVATVQAPRAEPMIKAMDGKEYIVKGYVIPLSGKHAQSQFMFSAYPYANCFFCGNAGPETVMEVTAKEGHKVAYSEKSVSIKGTFRYLGYKPNDIMFALEDAVLVED